MIHKNVPDSDLEKIGAIRAKDSVTYFDKSGKKCTEKTAVAKTIENGAGVTTYYVKHRRGEVFDPYGIDELKSQALDTRYKKVNESVFNNYKKYLDTRRGIYLLDAKREFIRGNF